MKVIIAQIKNPDITNEDMELSVRNYVKGVVDLVHEKRNISAEGHAEGQSNNGNLDEETIARFLENVKVSIPNIPVAWWLLTISQIFHSLKMAQHVDFQWDIRKTPGSGQTGVSRAGCNSQIGWYLYTSAPCSFMSY